MFFYAFWYNLCAGWISTQTKEEEKSTGEAKRREYQSNQGNANDVYRQKGKKVSKEDINGRDNCSTGEDIRKREDKLAVGNRQLEAIF